MILAALYIRVVAPPLAVPDSYRRLPYPVPSSPSRLPPVSHRFRKLSSGFITKEWPVDPKCGAARYATCAIFLRGILVAWSGCQRDLDRSPGPGPGHLPQPYREWRIGGIPSERLPRGATMKQPRDEVRG